MIRSTLLAAFIGLILTACAEKTEAETPLANEKMIKEVETAAKEMTEEASSIEAITENAETAVENAIESTTAE